MATHSSHNVLCALVLAAGFSTRMRPLLRGGSKALCALKGRMLLERCCDALRKAGIQEVYVVTGHDGDEVGAASLILGATPIYNAKFQEGMLSSIQAGINFLQQQSRHEAFFLLPVDIPLVKTAVIKKVAARWMDMGSKREGAIVIPQKGNCPGHPPLIGRAHWQGIGEWEGDGGLQGYIASLHNQPEAGGGGTLSVGLSEGGFIGEPSISKPSIGDPFRGESLLGESSMGKILAGKPLVVEYLTVEDEAVLWDIDTPEDFERAETYLEDGLKGGKV